MKILKKRANLAMPAEEIKKLLDIEDMEELSEDELSELGAKQGADIRLAVVSYEDGVIITLNLMSGTTNYWLEWAAFNKAWPLTAAYGLGRMLEPDFELSLENEIELDGTSYIINFEGGE